MIAPSFWAALAALVAGYFANHGVQISSDNLLITFQTLALIGGPLVVMVRQVLTGKSTWYGARPR